MRALLYIVMILVVSGCTYSNTSLPHGLDEVQSMLRDNPTKAFERLNEYDVAEFQDSATMARWALLYGEAMAANRFTAPTDTIINIAVSYYGSHNLDKEYQRACELKRLLAKDYKQNALASALYIQKEKEFMLYKERTRRNQFIFIGIIMLIAACGIITWQRQRLKLKEAQNDVLMAEASSLKKDLIHHQSECSSLASKLSVSLTNHFGVINDLCETYYESQGSKTERKAIVDKVKSHIEALKSNEGIFTEMERCHEDLLKQMLNALPNLKPEEYRLMVYLASGLSNRTIALLIGESIDVAYKRKSRLKAKISVSDIPDKERFMNVF